MELAMMSLQHQPFGALPTLAEAANEALLAKSTDASSATFGAVAPVSKKNKKRKSSKTSATLLTRQQEEEALAEEDEEGGGAGGEEVAVVAKQCGICSKQYTKSSIFSPCEHTIGCNSCMKKRFRDYQTCPCCQQAIEKITSVKEGRKPTNWEFGGATQAKRVADGLRKYNAIPRALLSENIRNGSNIILLSQDCQGRFMINMLGRAARQWGERNQAALEDFILNCAPTPQDLEERRNVTPDTRADYNIKLPDGCSKVNLVRIEGRDAPHYADYYVDGFAPQAQKINRENSEWEGVSFYPEGERNQPHYPSVVHLPSIGGRERQTVHSNEILPYFEEKQHPDLHKTIHAALNETQINAARELDAPGFKNYGPAVNALGRKPKSKSKQQQQDAAFVAPHPAPVATTKGMFHTPPTTAAAATTTAIIAPTRAKKLKKSMLQTPIILTAKQELVRDITMQWYNAFPSNRGIAVVKPLSQKLEMYVYLPAVVQE